MKVDFIELCASAFEPLVPRVAAQFDLSKEKTSQVLNLGGILMMTMMYKKLTDKEGVSDLYAAVSSTKIDANISVNLVNIFHSSLIFNNLLQLGGEQIKYLFHEKINTFYQEVAHQTGTDPEIVKSLTKIASVCVHGLLKRYLKIHHGQPHVLILLMQKNLLTIKNEVSTNIFAMLEIGKKEDFFQNVDSVLKNLSEEVNTNTAVSGQIVKASKNQLKSDYSQNILVALVVIAVLFIGINLFWIKKI